MRPLQQSIGFLLIFTLAHRAKRVPVPSAGENLPPIIASPPTSPAPVKRGAEGARARQPLASVTASKGQNLPAPPLAGKPSLKFTDHRRSRALADLAGYDENGVKREKAKGKENVANQRVREWAREKQRLREMQRLQELEQERDDEIRETQEAEKLAMDLAEIEKDQREKENRDAMTATLEHQLSVPGSATAFILTMDSLMCTSSRSCVV